MHLTEAEYELAQAFFAGIGEFVFPAEEDAPEQTAREELMKFSQPFPRTGSGRLILGRICNNPEIARLDDAGVLSVSEISPEDDGYEIRSKGPDVIVAGANARAVLHGLYALEEKIIRGEKSFDTRVVPYFRKRSDALGHYHSISVNLGNDTIDEAKAEYLARLGINQFCACFDLSPFGLHIQDFVKSDVFPFQRAPSPTAVRRLKDMSGVCKKYGIDFIFMLWEPVLPVIFARLEDYPREALGRVRRPWGGGPDHMETTLCVRSPIVQAHYRNIIGKFVREFPDVAGFFFYNLDGSSWLCTPSLCPRCREKLVDSDPDQYNPWETQAAFVTLLCEAAHEVRPDFTVNFWCPVHYYGDAVKKMYKAARGYDYVTTGRFAGDHDLFITNPEAPCQEVRDTLDAGPAYVYFAFNRLEAIQIGFPSPFTVAESLKVFKRWGFKRIMEVTGPTAALNQINAVVMKQFEAEPDTDTEPYLRDLARVLYGPEAGKAMYEVWERTRDAFECWRGFEPSPLNGSMFVSRISTFYGQVMSSVLPPVLDEYESFYLDITASVEPWKLEECKRTLSEEYIERFAAMEKCVAPAVRAAEKAYALATDDKIGLCYYEGSFEGLGRPTMKEYALLILSALQQAHSLLRQKVNMLRAVSLLRRMRDGSEAEKNSAETEYLRLIESDIPLQEEYAALLNELLGRRPCLPLTGICEDELRMYLRGTRKKIDDLREYLARSRAR